MHSFKFGAIPFLLYVLFIANINFAEAEIFGDGEPENGVEDKRQLLALTEVAQYQRFIGTIECADNQRGIAVLLSVKDSENEERQPILLTAKHVFPGASDGELEDCQYLMAGKPWQAQPLTSRYAKSGSFSVADHQLDRSRAIEFSQDWTLVKLSAWKNWSNSAFSLPVEQAARHLEHSAAEQDIRRPQHAFFIGFDEARGGFMVDLDCEFGEPEPDSLVGDIGHLVWDNCDSIGGSSGGVLFELSGSKPRIKGIRVGNLFDSEVYPEGPDPGDRFDLRANLNLSRTFDQEILDAIKLLVSPSSG